MRGEVSEESGGERSGKVVRVEQIAEFGGPVIHFLFPRPPYSSLHTCLPMHGKRQDGGSPVLYDRQRRSKPVERKGRSWRQQQGGVYGGGCSRCEGKSVAASLVGPTR